MQKCVLVKCPKCITFTLSVCLMQYLQSKIITPLAVYHIQYIFKQNVHLKWIEMNHRTWYFLHHAPLWLWWSQGDELCWVWKANVHSEGNRTKAQNFEVAHFIMIGLWVVFFKVGKVTQSNLAIIAFMLPLYWNTFSVFSLVYQNCCLLKHIVYIKKKKKKIAGGYFFHVIWNLGWKCPKYS